MKLLLKRFPVALICLFAAASPSAQDGLRTFHPDAFKEIILQAGTKPLVVLIWSLDCSYCLSSFQALAKAKATQDIEVATIATDPFNDAEARQLISQKLQAGGLTGPAWAFGPWPSARLRYAIDPKWRGELPRSYWYKDGRLLVSRSGAVTDEMTMKYFLK